MLDRLRAATGAAARGAGDRVRAARRRGAGSVPRRAGGAEPALRGGRGASAAVRRRRRAVARSGVGADARVRRPSAAGRAGRDGVRRREPGEELQLPELEVAGLRNGDARALLDSAVRFTLDERVRDRIVAETRGNPLALLELPRGLTAAELAGGFGLLGAHGATGRIEESFLRRLAALPADARRLLLLAAAEPVGDPLLLWRAAERLRHRAGGRAAVGGRRPARDRRARDVPASAGALGGVSIGDGRRSAAAVHRALADATDRRGRPGPPGLASGRRGGRTGRAGRAGAGAVGRSGTGPRRLAAAAAFLQRAVALTGTRRGGPSEPWRPRRRASGAGAFDAALGLLATAEAGPLDELQRARVDLLRAEVAFAQHAEATRHRCCLRAAAARDRSMSGSPARPISTPGARRCSPVAWPARRQSAGRLARRRARASEGPPRPRPAPRRPRVVFTEGRAARCRCCGGRSRRSLEPTSDGGGAPVGMARDAAAN